jgi:hypothetical protein
MTLGAAVLPTQSRVNVVPVVPPRARARAIQIVAKHSRGVIGLGRSLCREAVAQLSDREWPFWWRDGGGGGVNCRSGPVRLRRPRVGDGGAW